MGNPQRDLVNGRSGSWRVFLGSIFLYSFSWWFFMTLVWAG